MDTMDAICRRKSIRSYTGEKIATQDMKLILKAANAAPVGMGKYEGVYLTLIENQPILDSINKNAAQIFGNPDLCPLYGAPSFILVSAKADSGQLGNVEYSNAATIAHSMIIEATALGVGCCHIWGAVMALSKNPELVKCLDLPEGFAPCCGIILGKTAEEYSRREVPENRIAMNCFK